MMRFISGATIGWFLVDGIRLMTGKELTTYPTWVPIIGLAIIAAVNEIRCISKSKS